MTLVSTGVSRAIIESQGIPERAVSGPLTERLVSLDAYRGFVMIVLSLEGYLPTIAQKFPHSGSWQALGRQFVHVDWDGGVFWDLIQPSFMYVERYAVLVLYAFSKIRERIVGLLTNNLRITTCCDDHVG